MKIPPANDPSWLDAANRTAYLHGLMALHGISRNEVAELTDTRINTVHHWCSGKQWVIPRDTLRALAYDLKMRVSA